MRDTRTAQLSTVPPVSRALFAVEVADGPWIGDNGAVVARTGERGTWTRSATLAAVAAANGSYTAAESTPALEVRDGLLGWRLATTDALSWPAGVLPGAMSGVLEMVELGARTVANATLWSLRNDAASGAGLWLDTSNAFYRLNYSDGTTTRTATLTSGQPSTGQRVLFSWSLAATGALTLRQSINNAAPTTATAAALALPSAWASGARWRIGRRGSTANPAALWWRRMLVAPGVLSADQLAEVW